MRSVPARLVVLVAVAASVGSARPNTFELVAVETPGREDTGCEARIAALGGEDPVEFGPTYGRDEAALVLINEECGSIPAALTLTGSSAFRLEGEPQIEITSDGVEVVVVYEPTHGDGDEGALVVEHALWDQDALVFSLTGLGLDPIELERQLDLGVGAPGEVIEAAMELFNPSPDAISLRDLQVVGPFDVGFEPTVLEAGARLEIPVSFSADAAGDYVGRVILDTDCAFGSGIYTVEVEARVE